MNDLISSFNVPACLPSILPSELNTFRRDNDRFWILAVQKNSNLIAVSQVQEGQEGFSNVAQARLE